MPRLKNTPPTYRLHKPSGRAIVTFNGRDHYLVKKNRRCQVASDLERLQTVWFLAGSMKFLALMGRSSPRSRNMEALSEKVQVRARPGIVSATLRTISAELRHAKAHDLSQSKMCTIAQALEVALVNCGPRVLREATKVVCELSRYRDRCRRAEANVRREANERRLKGELAQLRKRCQVAEALPIAIPSIKDELDQLLGNRAYDAR